MISETFRRFLEETHPVNKNLGKAQRICESAGYKVVPTMTPFVRSLMTESINLDVIDAIEEFCDENGYDFRDDYSGRGMFGEKCIGIVVDPAAHSVVANSVAEISAVLNDYLEDLGFDREARKFLRKSCTDSMGLDVIVYYPSLSR